MNQKLKKLRMRLAAIALVITMMSGMVLKEGIVASAASGPYLIKVNKAACTVTIYKKDSKGNYTVPVKAMLCSPGVDTPLGTFRTPQKLRWHELMGPVWGQYCTRITGGVLFHSVWYYVNGDPSTLSIRQFNKLGTSCSHGCVRLNVEDAKWIYDNCPIGTTVTVYNDYNNPGPLGKPEAIKLPQGSGMGYDPTDIWSKGNPYNGKKPVISGAKDKTVKYGQSVNVKSGVTAKTTTGMDATKKIKVAIRYDGKTVDKVDSKKGGKYTVTYSVTDPMGRSAEKSVTYTVEGNNATPKITGMEEIHVNGSVKVDKELVLKNIKVKWGKESLDKNDVKVAFEELYQGEIQVTYTIKAPNGKSAKETAMIYVDDEAPTFSGVENKEIAWDTVVDEAFVRQGVKADDNFSNIKAKDIKVAIKEDKANGKYLVTYEAEDEVGNVGKAETTFTITDFLRIEGAEDIEFEDNMAVTDYYALSQGVKAFDKDVDITNSLQASVKEIEAGVHYEVTYFVSDAAGHMEEKTVTFVKRGTVLPEPTETPTEEGK